jgi:hypothetical protein
MAFKADASSHHFVILSEVEVREANHDALEGPHSPWRQRWTSQGILTAVAARMPIISVATQSAEGSFDSAGRFAKRISLLRPG